MDIISKELHLEKGLCVATHGHSSDFFLQLHLLSKVVAAKKPVVLIGQRESLNYRLACSRLAIRWDASLIHVVELTDLFGDDLRPSADSLFLGLERKIAEFAPAGVIFDDCSVFERFGFSASTVTMFIFSLCDSLPEDCIVYASFALESPTFKMVSSNADFVILFEPIGSGFGKDVSGKISIATRSSCALLQEKELLFLASDRSMKCFYPGSLQL